MRFLGDDWFNQPVNQALVTLHANTRRGRRDLCIAGDAPKDRSIISMHRNRYTYLTDQKWPGLVGAMAQVRQARKRGEPISLTTDFRCRSKFAYRLFALQERDALCPSLLRSYLRWQRHGAIRVPVLSPRFAYADTLTVYPDPNPESTSVDGYAYRSFTNSTWAALRDGAGTTANDSASLFVAYFNSGSTSTRWNILLRGFLLFDTSAAAGTVSAATLSVEGNLKSDSLGITPDINVYASAPASNTAIAAADFQNISRAAFSTAITYAAYALGSYNDFILNASGIANVDTAGVSKFSAQNANYDVADAAPAWIGSKTTSLSAKNAETAETTSDPKLVVTYTTGPPEGTQALLGVGR